MWPFKRSEYVEYATRQEFVEHKNFWNERYKNISSNMEDLQHRMDELKRLVPVHVSTDFGQIIQKANREMVKPKRKCTKKTK